MEAIAALDGFEPSVWGDFFINYKPQPSTWSEKWMGERVAKLKNDVIMLFGTCNNVVGKLNLVDAIQRLGIDHIFEEQVDAALSYIHGSEFSSSSLHEVALRFRLLREHGLWVSPDVFDKFEGEDGSFNKDVTNDPRGLLSLYKYNAAHLFIHGEPALDEAVLSTRGHLEAMSTSLNFPLAKQVERALHLPLPRTLKRVETVCYISEYEHEEGHSPSLLELEKLEFNLLQQVHLKELEDISEWWKDFYGYVELSYARDRVVECYFWSYAVFYEQEYALARMILAKLFAIVTLMDDTYDVRATIEECRNFNAAIQRWDESAVPVLPEYLKKYYMKLLSNFKDFEDQLAPNKKYRNAYSKKAFQILSTYYLQEAEWSHGNHKPCFKDQVSVSAMSSGCPALIAGLLVGMGDEVTKEAMEWASASSDAVLACGDIGRFVNDIASIKRGRNKGDVASTVECYISDHKVTSEVAVAVISSLIESGWKTTNQARFDHRAMISAVQRVVNLTASMHFIYDHRDDACTFSNQHLQKMIERVFRDPIPI